MARKPRLVHEGSPIVDVDIDDGDIGGISNGAASAGRGNAGRSIGRRPRRSYVIGNGAAETSAAETTVLPQYFPRDGGGMSTFGSSSPASSTTAALSDLQRRAGFDPKKKKEQSPYRLRTRLVVGQPQPRDLNNGAAVDGEDADSDQEMMVDDYERNEVGDGLSGQRRQQQQQQYSFQQQHIFHHSNGNEYSFREQQQQHGLQSQQPHSNNHLCHNQSQLHNDHHPNHREAAAASRSVYLRPPSPSSWLPPTSAPEASTERHSPSPETSPLVIIDGANVAYAFADAARPSDDRSRRRSGDSRGIRFAVEYFASRGCRVQAVVPATWFRRKPSPADSYHHPPSKGGGGGIGRGGSLSDALMVTDEVEELRKLRVGRYVCACPPGDDDDAYALALARRENDRVADDARGRKVGAEDNLIGGEGSSAMAMDEDKPSFPREQYSDALLPPGGYVLSNDFFHDAARRDRSLKDWLGRGGGRISYAFANVGSFHEDPDDEPALEFMPNPRHVLIEAVESRMRAKRQT